VLVAVGGVLDQLLLRQLEALGLAASGFLDGAALLAATPGELDDRLGGGRVVHVSTVLLCASAGHGNPLFVGRQT
jgi:hypothetical protein